MESVPEFELKEIRILPEVCKKSSCLGTPEAYLKEFSKQDTSQFCLAYLLTYLDFHKGLAGLASSKSICVKSGNTGFITALNYDVSNS